MYNAKDYSGLLLLASSLGDAESMAQLAELAHSAGKENIAFTAYMTLNNIPKCLQLLVETERYPEAAIMAKTYMPSEVYSWLSLTNFQGYFFTRLKKFSAKFYHYDCFDIDDCRNTAPLSMPNVT